MIKEYTFTGKSVEDALALASKELQKDVSELEYTVTEEAKRGFLGIGSSDAKILVKFVLGVREATEDFLRTFLANAGIDAEIRCEEKENGDIAYSLVGDDLGVLIGHHGEVLDSLQYLLSLVTNRHGDDFIRVTVDVENYRSKRENTLRALARKTAQRVKKSGRNVTFEPMSAYERRIIHSQAQEIEGVTTHSIGSGDERRVVMSLVGGPRRQPRPKKQHVEPQADKPKVVYEYNPVREPRTIVKAKSIDDINLADVEDTEMVNL
ncbi:MAG: protein jag [Clostridia bacterium]|nr:protein jag [Clostridia bacterium]